MPTAEPKKGAMKNVNRTSFHPRNAPIIAMSFTSPPPIASFLKTALPKTPARYMAPDPASAPIKEFKNVGPDAALNTSPAPSPPKETSSGISPRSKSTKVATTSRDINNIPIKNFTDNPKYTYDAKNRPAVNASTIRYLYGTFALQNLHRPPSARKLTMGILQYQGSALLQLGQCEAGLMMDSPRGRRCMQTFRKLPIIAPAINTIADITFPV